LNHHIEHTHSGLALPAFDADRYRGLPL
jgi:hypothetical protein